MTVSLGILEIVSSLPTHNDNFWMLNEEMAYLIFTPIGPGKSFPKLS
jgi:hypothetical protein